MRSLMLRSGALSLFLFPSFLSAGPALAQKDDPDQKAYYSYQLTMPKYKRYLAAMVRLANASQRTPAVKQAVEASLDSSIDEAVAHFNRVPEARRSITGAGLTTRNFVLTMGAYVHAGVAYGMIKQGAMSPDSALTIMQVSPANLDFVRKNEAEIARLTKEAEAQAPALKEATGNRENSGEDESE